MHGAESKLRYRRGSPGPGKKMEDEIKGKENVPPDPRMLRRQRKRSKWPGGRCSEQDEEASCLDFALDGAVDEDRSGTRGCLR